MKGIIRMVEILKIARKLEWTEPPKGKESYPTMQLSEVEKCMLAMVNDDELEKFRKWYKEMKHGANK